MSEQSQLLQKINEISFTVNDLTLYLDTHPYDAAALDRFSKFAKERSRLLKQYAEQFDPLTSDCIHLETESAACSSCSSSRHFAWLDGPLPWEGGM